MKKTYLGLCFQYIGLIEPEIDSGGRILSYMPQSKYKNAVTARLNKYGAGPFCKFKIAKGYNAPGIYIITLNDNPVYVGECINLENRYSSSGYGGISPRNCYAGGQETNCRINNLIHQAVSNADKPELWFYKKGTDKDGLRAVEAALIKQLGTKWNR